MLRSFDASRQARFANRTRRLITCAGVDLWSHPPGLNRRPADYETIRVKSHVYYFFSNPPLLQWLREPGEKPGNYGKHMRHGPRADKTADKKATAVTPNTPLRNGCGLGSLHRNVKSFLAYYHESRTHLSSLAGQGHAGTTACATAGTRSCSCHTASRRPSPPVPTAGSLNTAVDATAPALGHLQPSPAVRPNMSFFDCQSPRR
jgi:hypothetical protein